MRQEPGLTKQDVLRFTTISFDIAALELYSTDDCAHIVLVSRELPVTGQLVKPWLNLRSCKQLQLLGNHFYEQGGRATNS